MATYYIDPYNGNNSNEGSEALPKVSPPASSAGDIWYFKRGTVYTISSAMNVGANSMTVGAYGSGDKPVIKQINTTTGHAITLNSVTNCTIQDLDIWHPSTTDGVGVRISAGSGHTIQRNNIHGSRYGIFFLTDAANLKILDNNIYDIGDDGIGSGACVGGQILRNRIWNVGVVYPASGDCINFGDATGYGNWRIADNYCHYDKTSKQAIITGVSSAAHLFVIENNYVYTTAGGIHVRGFAKVLRNRIVCSPNADFGIQCNSGTNSQTQTVMGNVIVCEGAYLGGPAGSRLNAIRIAADAGASIVHDINIYNNTITGNVYRGLLAGADIDNGVITIKNNLFNNSVGNPFVAFSINAGAGATFTESHTAVYGFSSNAVGITLTSPITSNPNLNPVNYKSNLATLGTYIAGKDFYGRQFKTTPTIGAVETYDVRTTANRIEVARSEAATARSTERRG